MKYLFCFFLSIFSCFLSLAQELRCNVIINSDRVQTQEKQVFTQMKDAITQFMNSTKWTSDDYKENERIKCNISITLKNTSKVAEGFYEADLQIQSSRPIYQTNYESTMINYLDRNFVFEYAPAQPLIFTENAYSTNLTATLAYYAYLILALDYDSFGSKSGTPQLDRLLNILNNAQQGGGSGWTSTTDFRNRANWSENLNNPQFLPFREALYLYHRVALDQFNVNPNEAQKKIIEALEKIKQVQQVKPMSIVINSFFEAKWNELVNFFSQGEPETVKKAVDLLLVLDPEHTANYKKLLNQ